MSLGRGVGKLTSCVQDSRFIMDDSSWLSRYRLHFEEFCQHSSDSFGLDIQKLHIPIQSKHTLTNQRFSGLWDGGIFDSCFENFRFCQDLSPLVMTISSQLPKMVKRLHVPIPKVSSFSHFAFFKLSNSLFVERSHDAHKIWGGGHISKFLRRTVWVTFCAVLKKTETARHLWLRLHLPNCAVSEYIFLCIWKVSGLDCSYLSEWKIGRGWGELTFCVQDSRFTMDDVPVTRAFKVQASFLVK